MLKCGVALLCNTSYPHAVHLFSALSAKIGCKSSSAASTDSINMQGHWVGLKETMPNKRQLYNCLLFISLSHLCRYFSQKVHNTSKHILKQIFHKIHYKTKKKDLKKQTTAFTVNVNWTLSTYKLCLTQSSENNPTKTGQTNSPKRRQR